MTDPTTAKALIAAVERLSCYRHLYEAERRVRRETDARVKKLEAEVEQAEAAKEEWNAANIAANRTIDSLVRARRVLRKLKQRAEAEVERLNPRIAELEAEIDASREKERDLAAALLASDAVKERENWKSYADSLENERDEWQALADERWEQCKHEAAMREEAEAALAECRRRRERDREEVLRAREMLEAADAAP